MLHATKFEENSIVWQHTNLVLLPLACTEEVVDPDMEAACWVQRMKSDWAVWEAARQFEKEKGAHENVRVRHLEFAYLLAVCPLFLAWLFSWISLPIWISCIQTSLFEYIHHTNSVATGSHYSAPNNRRENLDTEAANHQQLRSAVAAIFLLCRNTQIWILPFVESLGSGIYDKRLLGLQKKPRVLIEF
jgi:hypothetical protein